MRFFAETRFWKPQCVGMAGILCLFLGLIGPLLQHPSMFRRGSWLDISFPANGPSLLGTPDLLIKAVGLIVLLLGIGAAWAVFNLRFKALQSFTLGILIVIFLLASTGIKNIDVYDSLSLSSVIPAYFPAGQRVSFGWAWWMLFLAPLTLWIASRIEEEPSESQRAQIMATTAPMTLQDLTAIARNFVAPSRAPAPTAATQAAAASDVGFCSACGVKNSTRATKCHACGALLPWEELRQNKTAVAAQTSAARRAQVTSQVAVSGGSVGGVLLTGLQGFLIFCFCSSAPFLGFFLWRYLDNEGSRFSSLALYSTIIGAVLHALRFLFRALAIVQG